MGYVCLTLILCKTYLSRFRLMLLWLISLKSLKVHLTSKDVKHFGFTVLILCLITILPIRGYAEKTQTRSPMTTLMIKQYIKTLETKPKLLVKSLNKLKSLQERTGQVDTSLQKSTSKQSSVTKRKIKKRLKQTIFFLSTIYPLVTNYFQAERSNTVQSKLYLKLRKKIWQLLSREQKLFQGSDGRFCLRSNWERLIAQSYLSVNQYKLAQHHFLRAYQCGGSNDDLKAAQEIKH